MSMTAINAAISHAANPSVKVPENLEKGSGNDHDADDRAQPAAATSDAGSTAPHRGNQVNVAA